jgi:hypothetical protein
VPVAELPVPHIAEEAAVHGVVYLRRYHTAEVKLIPLPGRTATERACQDLYSAGEIRAKHAAVLEILANVPTWELQYCNLNEGVKALELLTRTV